MMRRDCNAGYQIKGQACVPCANGTYHSQAVLRTSDSQPPNACLSCTNCQSLGPPQTYFQVSACNATQNAVCQACNTSCGLGSFIAVPCSLRANIVCQRCVTACPSGYYLSAYVCPGNSYVDLVLQNCQPCDAVTTCTPGQSYMPGKCTYGNLTASPKCNLCTNPVALGCPANAYLTGCVNYTNSYCQPYTACPAGSYLSGYSNYHDGVCRNCTNCSAQGLNLLEACTATSDSFCGYQLCGPATNCPNAPGGKQYFCQYEDGATIGGCGACPVSPSARQARRASEVGSASLFEGNVSEHLGRDGRALTERVLVVGRHQARVVVPEVYGVEEDALVGSHFRDGRVDQPGGLHDSDHVAYAQGAGNHMLGWGFHAVSRGFGLL